MKKTLLLLASAALLLVGCAKEQLSNGLEGELTKVTFTASLESGVATRAAVDGDGAAASVNRCIMEIYYGGELFTRQYAPVNQKKATFTVQVVSNRKYTVAFWADKVDATTEAGLQVDKYYTTNATGGLQAITINSSYIGNDDARDAFYHVGEYTVAQAGSSFGGGTEKILLKRPFAQMNVITTDWDKVASIAALEPEKVNVTLKNALVAFNAVTGEASGSENLTYTADVYTPAAHGAEKTLSMDYLFASTTKGVIDIDWKALHGTDTNVEHSFAAVPYQRNYRTNIKGKLLTTTGQWTVTVEPTWGNPDYDVPFLSASTIKEAQNYIAPTEEGTQKAKVVDLSKATITEDDVNEEDGTIHFILKTTSPEDLVNFTLPAIPTEVGATGWTIEHQTGYPTQNVNVTAPTGTSVTIDAPNSHVTLNGSVYNQVTATTGPSTLVVPAGVTVKNLTVEEGGVEIHGCVEIVSVTGTAETVFVRECENLTQAVYDELKDYIAPNYTGVQNTDGSWNIELEDFWPNFAAAEFSAIDQSGKTLTISTPAELALLAKNINAGTSYAGYTISISGNLDMSAHYWIPINAYNGYLSGATIKGDGNAVISNLKIENCVNNNTSGYNYYSGFIGQIVGKLTFKDLTFSGADVKVDNGSGIAVVLGLTYSDVLFDNVKVMNSTVSSNTKVGALVGFTGGDCDKVTIKNCALENVTVKAAYSYALMVGLINVRDQVAFEGNNVVDSNTHAVYDEVVGHKEEDIEETKDIKGYTYGVDGTKLWVIGVQDAWAELRTSPTPKKTIDNVEYSVMGDIFYHADGVVVDVCAPDPVAQIGDAKYATLAEAFTAVQEGQTIEIIQAGSYAIPSPINNITVKGADDLVTVADEWGTHPTVVFDASQSSGQLSKLDGVIFSNIKFLFSGNGYTGFQHQGATVTFNKCDFEGLYNGYGNMIYNNCYFKQSKSEYVMWTYGSRYLEFNNCKFNVAGKALNVYQENDPGYDHIIKINNCNFVSSTANKPALAIKNNGNGGSGTSPIFYDITITNSTFEGFGQSDGDLMGFPTDAPYVNAYGYNGATQPLKVTVDSEVRVNIPKN